MEKDYIAENKNESILIPKSELQYKREVQTGQIENGYHFPPKYPWNESIIIMLRKFGKFIITPFGFFVTLYGLNIVGWGGMLFLLICNAAPSMCKPTCEESNSSRHKWIEIDSQVLNGLFCVTGFGTIPWRFRDLWYLLQYRVLKNDIGLKKLAVINRNWFRISSTLDKSAAQNCYAGDLINVKEITFHGPEYKSFSPSLTGLYAPPTATWKLDLVIWAMIWNTVFQAVLSGLMWGLNYHERPGWSTGLFITLGCIAGGIGGLIIFLESQKVKAIEGVEVTQQDLARLAHDQENGILHYNNIKDKKPK
ncbi:hypothetical protein HI914_04608 [Erysiphe necator]|nr:hypothetical protein HI914_04608 [Erysiphe necator]